MFSKLKGKNLEIAYEARGEYPKGLKNEYFEKVTKGISDSRSLAMSSMSCEEKTPLFFTSKFPNAKKLRS